MKKALLIAGLVLIIICSYYLVVIVNARQKTEGIVHKALTSGRMKLELKDLSNEQFKALLKIEDPNFYHHKGYDFTTPGAGVTTISQALVKMYYFENFKPGLQKISQTLISRFAFDNLTPKDTILKLFINEVYLGQNNGLPIKGFEGASNFYFNKTFSQLSWDKYLSILAMIIAPNTYRYSNHHEANQDRVARIKRMLTGEYVPIDNSDLLYDRR